MVIRHRPQAVASRKTPQELQQASRQRRERQARLFGLYAGDAKGTLRLPRVTWTATVVTIWLPHRLESPNVLNWRDWRLKARAKTAWAFRLRYAIDLAEPRRAAAPPHLFPTLASRLDWTPPTNRPAVIVSRHVPSRRNFIRDRENRYFAAKPVVDCLVQAGFLTDDREKDIDLQVEQAVAGDGLDWTVLTIDARAPELRTLPEAGA